MPRAFAELEAAAEKLDAEVAEVRGRYEAAAAKLQERREALFECERGIADLKEQRTELEREATDAAVNKKKLEHKCALAFSTLLHTSSDPTRSALRARERGRYFKRQAQVACCSAQSHPPAFPPALPAMSKKKPRTLPDRIRLVIMRAS